MDKKFLVGREVKESALEKKFLVGREVKESAREKRDPRWLRGKTKRQKKCSLIEILVGREVKESAQEKKRVPRWPRGKRKRQKRPFLTSDVHRVQLTISLSAPRPD